MIYTQIIKLYCLILLLNYSMTNQIPFSKRIDLLNKDKETNLILAIDPLPNTYDLFNYIIRKNIDSSFVLD